MKRILLSLVLFAGIGYASLFAWEAEDLMKFPPCMDKSSWILNLGVGFHGYGLAYLGRNDFFWIPPVRLSFDKNVALGDNGLPFFFGGLVSYSGYGWKKHYFRHRIGAAFRCGYHFNWDVDRLDTYAVTNFGANIHFSDDDFMPNPLEWVNIGINIGARYFVTDWFGFWAEAGVGSYYSVDIGIAFKF